MGVSNCVFLPLPIENPLPWSLGAACQEKGQGGPNLLTTCYINKLILMKMIGGNKGIHRISSSVVGWKQMQITFGYFIMPVSPLVSFFWIDVCLGTGCIQQLSGCGETKIWCGVTHFLKTNKITHLICFDLFLKKLKWDLLCVLTFFS